jgi:type II secretory pathway predicted ATPase ExeA
VSLSNDAQLPERRSAIEWTKILTASPSMPDDLSSLSAITRLEMLREVLNRRFLIPNAAHGLVASTVEEMLAVGLAAQDLTGKGYHHRCEMELEGLQPISPAVDDHRAADPLCGCLLGCPGLAKSRTIRATLRTIDQCVSVRSSAPGRPLLTQIRYLNVAAPTEGSISAFATQFFDNARKVLDGSLLNAGTLEQLARSKALDETTVPGSQKPEKLERRIKSFVQQYGVGLIVIDEVQNLDARFWHGRERLINFLVSLTNDLGTSILLVGSGAVLETLFDQLRFSRRFAKRSHLWDPPECDDTWRDYINGLMKLQITNDRADFSDDMAEAIWQQTQGLYDLSNTLFERLQEWLVLSQSGALTPELITVQGPQYMLPFAKAIQSVKEQRMGRRWTKGDGDYRLFGYE